MKKSLLALYSLAHFWVDLSCAFLLLGRLRGGSGFAVYLLLYNFCAFALQMPFGLLADRLDRNSTVAVAGCCLTALAYLSPLPLLAAVTAGVGNALFHLGGGIDVLNASKKRAAALGVFVSPGAMGLYIGSLWSRGTSPPLWLAPVGLLALSAAILRLCPFRSGNAPLNLKGGYGLVLPLFLVVVLRSYVGMNQSFSWKSGYWAILLTLALVLGKAAGGFLMDRFGSRRTAVVSLALAAVLYLVSAFPLPGTLAVFLFNMTMPVTLWAVAHVMPGAKGFGFGLLTFALFLGFLPTCLGWPSVLTGPVSYAVVTLLSLALLWKGVPRC